MVALSTCEAEFISLSLASQEALYLKALLGTIIKPGHVTCPTTIYCDNQPSILLAENPLIHQRSKHIDIKYQFIRDEIKKNTIKVQYIQSENNVADVFTKPMTKLKLSNFIKMIVGSQT